MKLIEECCHRHARMESHSRKLIPTPGLASLIRGKRKSAKKTQRTCRSPPRDLKTSPFQFEVHPIMYCNICNILRLIYIYSGQDSETCISCIYIRTHARTYVRMYVYVCMYVGTYVRTYVCMCAYMYVRMSACMHVCMYACLHVCMYTCMHVCMYACMHVCMYVCTM